MNGENVRLYTPGNQIRDWLYVDDHCRAIDAILQKGKIGETYCIGGMTSEISNREVAEAILEIMNLPKERLELVTDRPGHDLKYAVDWTKINRELGWAPAHNFEDWLRTTVEWYQNNRLWWETNSQESENFYQIKGEKILS
jgi:dTDP-glucose 4,6-dehydratase